MSNEDDYYRPATWKGNTDASLTAALSGVIDPEISSVTERVGIKLEGTKRDTWLDRMVSIFQKPTTTAVPEQSKDDNVPKPAPDMMPYARYAMEDQSDQQPPLTCQETRERFIACALETDCVKRQRNMKSCIENEREVAQFPIKCQRLLALYRSCYKRRLTGETRFRGNVIYESELAAFKKQPDKTD